MILMSIFEAHSIFLKSFQVMKLKIQLHSCQGSWVGKLQSLQLLQSYLLAASLISVVSVQPVSFGGGPCLGQFAVVPYSFQFQMMDWAVLLEIQIFLEPNPALNWTLSLPCLVCSFDFLMLFVPQYSLNKPLRRPQIRWVYTEISLYLIIRSTFGHSAVSRQLLKATSYTHRKGASDNH